jgi:hypothetical protein
MHPAGLLMALSMLLAGEGEGASPEDPKPTAPAEAKPAAAAPEGTTPGDKGVLVGEGDVPSIVAVVGGSYISRSQFQKELNRRLAVIRARNTGFFEVPHLQVMQAVLQDLVDEELIYQSALQWINQKTEKPRELAEIIPLEKVHDEIDRRVDELRKAGNREIVSREDYFAQYLKDFGQSREKVIEDVRKQILVNGYLWEVAFPGMDRFIAPSESRSFYRAHRDDFTTPITFAYRRIEFGDDFSAPGKVKEIQEALKRSESFVDLAKKYSEEFESESLQGKLWEKTYQEVQSMPFPVPQILRRMKNGEVSGPHRVQGKVIFFLLEKVETGDPLPYEKAQPAIEKQLLGRRRQAGTRALLRRLKEGTRVETYIPGIELDYSGGPGDEHGEAARIEVPPVPVEPPTGSQKPSEGQGRPTAGD